MRGAVVSQPVLSVAEELTMKATFKATMLRAADIIDRITADDVLAQQAEGLRQGMTLAEVSRIDRAMVAAAHLRLCAAVKVSDVRYSEDR